MYRGFLICHKALLADKDILNTLYPEESYIIRQANDYFVISSGSSGSVSPADFFQVPFDSNTKIYVYGYITHPFEIDFRNANKMELITSHFSHNRNMHYFTNKSQDLNGSFTIIRISSNGEIVIFTDRLGTRPVYYSRLNGHWVVSSTGGLLLPLKKIYSKVSPNFIAFTSLLLRSRPLDRLTLIEDIYRTDAGEVIILSPNLSEKRNKWYKPKNISRNTKMSFEEKLEELETSLNKSAERLSSITCKPLLFLSGGMDSRLAAVIFKDKIKDLEALTLCDTINNEARIARRVASELGLKHKFYLRDKYYYLKNLEKLVTSCLGSYFYIHGHFSMALQENPCYEDIYLGDFLESVKKLIGFRTDVNKIVRCPEDIVTNIFLIDDYSSRLKWETLNVFNGEHRDRLRREYFEIVLQEAEEAFEVADEVALVVDYFLRWRRAYEISTFGMFEDIRLLKADKNLAWDNDYISFLFKLNTADRTRAKLGIRLIEKRNRNLVMKIPDANTLIPPGYSDSLKKLVKNIRRYGALMRRQLLRSMGRPALTGMHSWQNSDYLNVSDLNWKNYLQQNVLNDLIFETKPFDADFIRLAWHRYCQYDFSNAHIIYALLNYSILFQ